MKLKQPKISIAIPVYNSTSTLPQCIKSIKIQNIQPVEVIFIDNKSTDDSVKMIKEFIRSESNLKIILLTKRRTSSVASSYNMALKKARGELFLTMHSDSVLPTKQEIKKLIAPLAELRVCATYSYSLHPKYIWNVYNFWEKCLLGRVVDTRLAAMNGKFDCYRTDILKKIGGYDELNFDENGDALDADIYHRLNEIGLVVLSEADVVHLHYMRNDYKLSDWIKKRKDMAIIAGRLLKMYKNKVDLKGIVAFSFRPILAFLPFIPAFRTMGIFFLVLFSIFFTKRMFTTRATIMDVRILSLPFINIFLVYYETYWMIYTLLTHRVKKVQTYN